MEEAKIYSADFANAKALQDVQGSQGLRSSQAQRDGQGLQSPQAHQSAQDLQEPPPTARIKKLIIFSILLVVLGGVIAVPLAYNNANKSSGENTKPGLREQLEAAQALSPIPVVSSTHKDSYEQSEAVSILFQGPTQAYISSEFEVKILLDAGEKSISGVEVYASYPEEIFEIVSIEPDASFPTILEQPRFQNGTISMVLGSSSSNPQTGIVKIATMKLIPKSSGNGKLQFMEESRVTAVEYESYIHIIPSSMNVLVQ